MKPPLRFAKTTDGGNVAYTSFGAGYPLLQLDISYRVDIAREWEFPSVRRVHERYAQYFTLIRFEPRGLPNSDPPPRGRRFHEWVLDDIDAVVGALSLQNLALATGGWLSGIGARYAAQRSDLVTHAILLNPTVAGDTRQQLAEANSGYESTIQVRADLSASDYATQEALDWLQPSPDPDEVRLLASLLRSHHASAKSQAMWDGLRLDDQAPLPLTWLPRLRAKTLVVSTGPFFDADCQLAAATVVDAVFAKTRPRPGWETPSDEEILELAKFVYEADPPAMQFRPQGLAAASGLTRREAEILALVAAGHSNNEIADSLVLSVGTVTRHVANIYEKLGIHNRAQATAFHLGARGEGNPPTRNT